MLLLQLLLLKIHVDRGAQIEHVVAVRNAVNAVAAASDCGGGSGGGDGRWSGCEQVGGRRHSDGAVGRAPDACGLVDALGERAVRILDNKAALAPTAVLGVARPDARGRSLRCVMRARVLHPPQAVGVEHLRTQELGLDAAKAAIEHVAPATRVEAVYSRAYFIWMQNVCVTLFVFF